MVTYTKRAYLADIAANEAAIVAVQAELVRFSERLEAGESIADLSDAWNAAHDLEWSLTEERADIERRWSRRRWTGADHAAYELVAANID